MNNNVQPFFCCAKLLDEGFVGYGERNNEIDWIDPKNLEKIALKFRGSRITMGHPLEQINAQSDEDYAKYCEDYIASNRMGYVTDVVFNKEGIKTYTGEEIPADYKWYIFFLLDNQEAINFAKSGYDISCGYLATEMRKGSVINGIEYDKEIIDIDPYKMLHVALVEKGRYQGTNIRFNKKENMIKNIFKKNSKASKHNEEEKLPFKLHITENGIIAQIGEEEIELHNLLHEFMDLRSNAKQNAKNNEDEDSEEKEEKKENKKNSKHNNDEKEMEGDVYHHESEEREEKEEKKENKKNSYSSKKHNAEDEEEEKCNEKDEKDEKENYYNVKSYQNKAKHNNARMNSSQETVDFSQYNDNSSSGEIFQYITKEEKINNARNFFKKLSK